MMINKTIKVDWSIAPKTGTPPASQYIWKSEGNLPIHRLETQLGWPTGTIWWLEQAFSKGINRQLDWVLSSKSPKPHQVSLDYASSVYKRGTPSSLKTSKTPNGSYDVIISSQAPKLDPKRLLVVDRVVAQHWKLEHQPNMVLVDASETRKNLDGVASLLKAIADLKEVDRDRCWQVVGGGLISDMAGFAASILRADFELFPTTLLAMVDASVGGKTGVNHQPYGKNQLGRFHFPHRVTIWPGWLASLSRSNVLAGGAECLKHAMLGDSSATLFQQVVACLQAPNPHKWQKLLPQLIQIKINTVAADPLERGVRVTLNLGHTLAHALESLAMDSPSAPQSLLHGEAVGIGLIFALMLSREMGRLSPKQEGYLIKGLLESGCILSGAELAQRVGTVVTAPANFQLLWERMLHDKKNHGAEVYWVLLDDLGRPTQDSQGSYLTPIDQMTCARVWKQLWQML